MRLPNADAGGSMAEYDDVIVGTDGQDFINGKGGDDKICAKDGFDSIKGGSGKDVIEGWNPQGHGCAPVATGGLLDRFRPARNDGFDTVSRVRPT